MLAELRLESLAMICLAFMESLDPPLLATFAVMLAVLACGGVAIWLTYRWYRTQKQPDSTAGEALAQLVCALEKSGELQPEEMERVRVAIERQRDEERRAADVSPPVESPPVESPPVESPRQGDKET